MAVVYIASVDFDTPTIQSALAKFEELARSSYDILIDMGGVSFIDGAGLGALVFLFKRLRAKGYKLTLTNLTGQPHRMLTDMQLIDLLGAPARADAIASFHNLFELPNVAQAQGAPQVGALA